VAFYDQDRLHRNDVEFSSFMAEMTERRILVFDAGGLISNVDRLSWKIKAVVAQEEREKVPRRVRDNLAYLKRNGNLLGVIPQGYRRVNGSIIEDPRAAPIIQQIFTLYATGRFSVRSLADHLNNHGVRPVREPGKVSTATPSRRCFAAACAESRCSGRRPATVAAPISTTPAATPNTAGQRLCPGFLRAPPS
jgi:DNA invertase Pin-like site-specific DNA recombinase